MSAGEHFLMTWLVAGLVATGACVAGADKEKREPVAGGRGGSATGGRGGDGGTRAADTSGSPSIPVDAAKDRPVNAGGSGGGAGGAMNSPGIDARAPADLGGAQRTVDGSGTASSGSGAFAEIFDQILGVPFGKSPSSCADGDGASCHNPSHHIGLDFISIDRTYDLLVPYFVQPGLPDSSRLLLAIEHKRGANGEDRKMPKGRPQLPKEMIDKVRAWINAGAPRGK